MKAKIENTLENGKCMLCGDRDETVNHIISECSKQAQRRWKTRYDCVGKVIHSEFCKRLKSDHTIKWSMIKARVRRIKLSEIQTELQTPILVMIHKKKELVKFAVSADNKVNIKENKTINKYLDIAREKKEKLLNLRMTVKINLFDALGTVPKFLLKKWRDKKSVEELRLSTSQH